MGDPRVIDLLAFKASLQTADPLWRYNGPNANYVYSLTPAGKELFGVRERRITKKAFLQFRSDLADRMQQSVINPLVDQFAAGDISATEMVEGARDAVKRLYLGNYQIARGGRGVMAPEDFGRIGQQLRREYAYLDRFADELTSDGFPDRSAQYIKNRLGLYLKGGVRSFESGYLSSWGLSGRDEWGGELVPLTPGSQNFSKPGERGCVGVCWCTWQVEDKGDEVWLHWRLNPGHEHCINCRANAQEWNPIRIAKETTSIVV